MYLYGASGHAKAVIDSLVSSGHIIDGIFDDVTVSLTGRNLWVNTDYPGIDPETNLTGDSNGYGLDYFNMPNTKGWSATLKVTF